MTMCEEPLKSQSLASIDPASRVSVIFFLKETFENDFDFLTRDIKRCFFENPFDLKKIEIFTSNHHHVMIGRVHHKSDDSIMRKIVSSLFKTEFGASLYSKTLKGTFKVFSDLQTLHKVKDLINYF